MKNRSLGAIRAKRKSTTSGGLAKNSPVVRNMSFDLAEMSSRKRRRARAKILRQLAKEERTRQLQK